MALDDQKPGLTNLNLDEEAIARSDADARRYSDGRDAWAQGIFNPIVSESQGIDFSTRETVIAKDKEGAEILDGFNAMTTQEIAQTIDKGMTRLDASAKQHRSDIEQGVSAGRLSGELLDAQDAVFENLEALKSERAEINKKFDKDLKNFDEQIAAASEAQELVDYKEKFLAMTPEERWAERNQQSENYKTAAAELESRKAAFAKEFGNHVTPEIMSQEVQEEYARAQQERAELQKKFDAVRGPVSPEKAFGEQQNPGYSADKYVDYDLNPEQKALAEKLAVKEAEIKGRFGRYAAHDDGLRDTKFMSDAEKERFEAAQKELAAAEKQVRQSQDRHAYAIENQSFKQGADGATLVAVETNPSDLKQKQGALLAEREQLSEEEDRLKKERGQMEAARRQELYSFMDKMRDATHAQGATHAQYELETARANNASSADIALAEVNRDLQIQLRDGANGAVANHVSEAREYKEGLARGEAARKAGRAAELGDYVDALTQPGGAVDAVFKERLAEALKNAPPGQHNDIIQDIEAQKQDFKDRLAAGLQDGTLIEQIKFLEQRTGANFSGKDGENSRYDPAEQVKIRKEVFDAAIDHIYDGNKPSDSFALDYMREHKERFTNIMPVDLSTVAGTLESTTHLTTQAKYGGYVATSQLSESERNALTSRDAVEINGINMRDVKAVVFERDEHNERVVRFELGWKEGEQSRTQSSVVVSGEEAEAIYKRGLDLTEARGKIEVRVAGNVGVNPDNGLFIHGAEGKQVSVRGEGSDFNDALHQRDTVASVVSVGNEKLNENIKTEAFRLAAVQAKKDVDKGMNLVNKFDVNRDGSVDKGELRAMDIDGDGQLSTKELPKNVLAALSQLRGDEATMLALRSLGSGELKAVSIETLGNVELNSNGPRLASKDGPGHTAA